MPRHVHWELGYASHDSCLCVLTPSARNGRKGPMAVDLKKLLMRATALDVAEFYGTVLKFDVPDKGARGEMLEKERFEFALTALREEVEEFEDASDYLGQVDALVDIVYFAVGRLLEMGVPFGPAWDEVHRANMGKRRGGKGRDTEVDAAKPDGWTPPDLTWLLGPLEPFLAASRLSARKDEDYNRGPVRRDDYFPFGLTSYAHELHKKTLRLVSLAAGQRFERLDATPVTDTVEDTLLDLMNYAAYCWEWLKDREEQTAEQRATLKSPPPEDPNRGTTGMMS